MDVVIIDYGMGNTGAILNMIKKIGGNGIISNKIEDIKKAPRLILPGVGHFAEGMSKLKNLNLIEVIKSEVLDNKKKILGICLGYQLLTRYSEEGLTEGLGLIDAETKKFDIKMLEKNGLKSIHMGWNCVLIKKNNCISIGLNGSRFYFVHSYYVDPVNKDDILFTSNYGIEFAAGIQHKNIIGTQFHPEKSHKFGEKLIYNFLSCNDF